MEAERLNEMTETPCRFGHEQWEPIRNLLPLFFLIFVSENLAHIFSQGFNTRNDGHGFGLHRAASTAKESGASVGMRVPGPGAKRLSPLNHR